MRYKHFVFDVDGTLLDTEFAVLQAWKDTLLELQGKVYETQELYFALGIPGEVTLAKLGIRESKSAFEVWNGHFLKYNSTIKLFDNIVNTIKDLRERGLQLGVVTSKTYREFTYDTALRKITGYFGIVICATNSPRPKPFADPILTYMEKTKTRPEEIIYIGDTIYDCQCARSAGVDFGLAMWGNPLKEDINATYFLKTPIDILTI